MENIKIDVKIMKTPLGYNVSSCMEIPVKSENGNEKTVFNSPSTMVQLVNNIPVEKSGLYQEIAHSVSMHFKYISEEINSYLKNSKHLQDK